MADINDLSKDVTELKVNQQWMRESMVGLHAKYDSLAENFVTKAEFGPIRAIAYGIVSIVLGSILLALVGLLIPKGGGIGGP
jgi:hypothetical protein